MRLSFRICVYVWPHLNYRPPKGPCFSFGPPMVHILLCPSPKFQSRYAHAAMMCFDNILILQRVFPSVLYYSQIYLCCVTDIRICIYLCCVVFGDCVTFVFAVMFWSCMLPYRHYVYMYSSVAFDFLIVLLLVYAEPFCLCCVRFLANHINITNRP